MRCYLVKGPNAKRYAGTQADARSTRDMIVEETGCKKTHVTISEAEIPTAKAELLDFINDLCVETDNGIECIDTNKPNEVLNEQSV